MTDVIDGNVEGAGAVIDGDTPTVPWTEISDLVSRWRPLTPAETARAPGILGMVGRAVARRWPDIQDRLNDSTLDIETVRDVVSSLARQLLEVDVDVPLRAKSWQQTSGTESEAITLDGPLAGAMLLFDDWMVEALNSPTEEAAYEQDRSPLFSAPRPDRRVERAFEDWDTRWEGFWYE